ncbi:MAG: hypothetical protein KKE73_09760 [Proteobacteria bacterium]|nr:hypothetical protein [Pseudomonadota bacterium]
MSAIAGINISATLGGLRVDRCPRLTIESERHRPLSLGQMQLPDPDGSLINNISRGMEASITFGYRGQTPATWRGQVHEVTRGMARDQVDVRMQGLAEWPLASTLITETWMDETPEAILRWAAGQCGVSVATLDSPGITIPRVVASSIPLWKLAEQVAHTVQKASGQDMSAWPLWLGADGLHWGDHDEPGDVPVLETGKGLITHNPLQDGGRSWGEVETFLLPGFAHSRRFRIVDSWRSIQAQPRALRVTHEVTPDKARTWIRYGVEHERY